MQSKPATRTPTLPEAARAAAAAPIYNVFPCPRKPPNRPAGSSLADRLIQEIDRGLRTVAAANVAGRPFPDEGVPETVTDPAARRHAAALMRVNHAGEIAAQALYHGQALTARNPAMREHMLAAAREETDHLAWCERRVRDLDSRTSAARSALVRGLVRDRRARRPQRRPDEPRLRRRDREAGLRAPRVAPGRPAGRRRALAPDRRADEGRRGPARRRCAREGRRAAAARGARTDASHGAHHDRHGLSHLNRFRLRSSENLRRQQAFILKASQRCV